MPEKLKEIEPQVFFGCTSLISLIIPSQVQSIDGVAFNNCLSLKYVSIPSSVKTIKGNAFQGCEALQVINIEDLSSWCKIQFISDSYGNRNPLAQVHALFLNGEIIKDLVIPNDVNTISAYCFTGCSELNSLTIPHNVTSIGENAFADCTGLSKLSININVDNSIRKWLNVNSTIKEIIIGDEVTTIGDHAFGGWNKIEKIDIGQSVKSIGERAFAGSDNLSEVICRAVTVPETNKSTFENSYPDYAFLYVPEASIDKYKATAPWNTFKTISGIKDNVPEDAEKCETPTISYSNGKITFTCNTNDVVFVSDIKDSDIKNYTSSSIDLTASYIITVYSSKTGYRNSDVATATLCWIDVDPKTEGIENSIAQVRANPVLIQSNNGQITITGAEVGTSVFAYSVSGHMVASTHSNGAKTTLFTDLRRGEVAIIKIGDKSIKIVIQ